MVGGVLPASGRHRMLGGWGPSHFAYVRFRIRSQQAWFHSCLVNTTHTQIHLLLVLFGLIRFVLCLHDESTLALPLERGQVGFIGSLRPRGLQLEAFTCQTGKGNLCKSCKSLSDRTVASAARGWGLGC